MQESATLPRPSHSHRHRSGVARHENEMPRTPGSASYSTAPSNSTRSRGDDDRSSQTAPMQPLQTKKRTTITMQTGTWSLGKTVGAGSMGKVKIAKNLETGETCAIKIIPRSSTDEHKTAQERERADQSKEIRTAREAAIVTLLNHPYICGMRDFVRTHYHWYMLFEFVNGGQMLDYIISHGKLKEKVAKKFGRQIASALDYCHKNSIVHRDLKIENILISKAGDIKIIDFGLSNLFSPRSHLKTFCGSLYFAAPELLNAKAYTGPEVDVWSFGIVLYVLVCGKVPFDDQSMPQLHAKIKKGLVDYPSWLSIDCKNLLSRMLVTDPKQRIALAEVMSHPWMIKGFNGPPESYLPLREPLQLPLDPAVISKMHGFDFGTPEHITRELTRILESEDYQHAVAMKSRETPNSATFGDKKKGVFDFYKRRNSISSRDTLQNLSSEALPLGYDPINAYSPLISIYYLAREKLEREHAESNPGGLRMPPSATSEKPLQISDLPPPEAAYTNSNAYEMPGEKMTGGRARPRARTHGEDEISESLKKVALKSTPPSPAIVTTPAPQQQQQPKKESMAGGLLRRFSTRRGRDNTREHPPPALQLQPPNEADTTPQKSFSVRRSKTKDSPMMHSAGSQPNRGDLLSPPFTDGNLSRTGSGSRILNRSTSVNSGSFRRRRVQEEIEAPATGSSIEPPLTSGSDRSETATPRVKITEPEALEPKQLQRSAASRTKSLGHARRESIQARRSRREGKQSQIPEDTDVGEETEGDGPNEIKPVFLKGLFSVSTTSSKPLPVIRNDIIRVLRQLGVEYTEIRAGFHCQHVPSIDMKSITEQTPTSPDRPQFASPSHRRRISFGVFNMGEKERDNLQDSEKLSHSPSIKRKGDTNFAVSDESDVDLDIKRKRERPAGETTTHVDNDLGESLILDFEILIVKVPILSLHGIQFKKVSGGTWQYKSMAQKILDALRL